jgi:hypothetical protein
MHFSTFIFQSDSEEFDATDDQRRWQQQAATGRYVADLSTVDLTAVGYTRATMPGYGGGADEVQVFANIFF